MAYHSGMKMPGRAPALPRLGLARASEQGNARKKTLVFKTSTSWVAPKGVSFVRILEGCAAPGTQESGSHEFVDGYSTYSNTCFIDNNTGAGWCDAEWLVGTYEGSMPADYCTTPGSEGLSSYYCYRHEYVQFDYGDYVEPTVGQSATALGRTFTGDLAAPARPARFFSIRVVPGVSYPIVVPPGAYIRMTYR